MPNTKLNSLAFSAWMIGLFCGTAYGAITVEVAQEAQSPMLDFALEQIQEIKNESEHQLLIRKDDSITPQGFVIESVGEQQWLLRSNDAHGFMYGALDFAESTRLGRSPSKTSAPKIHRRGLKFNIPLDARCPSYDDSGDAAIRNIPEVWDREFWHEFLDNMAKHRFNVLSLWNNHPFTTMVKLDQYPDVAIEDVAVPTYPMNAVDLIQYRKAKLQDPRYYKVVKKMSIEEKIDHWQYVMRYAKHRGIDIYFLTWNIWLHGAEGKYGINDSQTNEKTIAYVRESMKQMVLTYPDLKGFGVTAGENMQNKLKGKYNIENWLWRTYGQGVADALEVQPDRKFDFIHRIWYTGIDGMKEPFLDRYPGRCDVGFKYARARLYSTTKPTEFDRTARKDVEKHGLRCWMNLRNDDIYNFRWGDPQYVREFIGNLPPEPTLAGYVMGSDGYVWGREFTSTHPTSPRQLEIDKHWFRFMLWGRLSYDPSLTDEFFTAKLADRFPDVDAQKLLDTWRTASQIVPKINLVHWRDWDHMWSVETCMSKKEGYHSVDHFIEFGPWRNSSHQSIQNFVRYPKQSKKESPLKSADRLDQLSEQTLAGVAQLRSRFGPSPSQELEDTVADMEAFAFLANYYADKLRSATMLHRFRVNGDNEDQQKSIHHIENAIKHWQQYGEIASRLYTPQLLARVNTTDWMGLLLEEAKKDLQIIKASSHNVFPESKLHSVGH